MSTLRIHLLGQFRLDYAGETVTAVNSDRLRSLLAYLVLHRHAHIPRRHLAFTLWPDSTEAQAQTNLRKLLYQLRRALPDAGRFVDGDHVAVWWQRDAPFSLDVADMEVALGVARHAADPQAALAALEGAIDLYRGDLLPGLYDDWLVPERERLRQAFLGGVAEAVRRRMEAGDDATALRCAEQLLHFDPMREETYRDLMLLHARAGNHAAVRVIYQACVATLRDQFGVEPSPATVDSFAEALATSRSPAPAGPHPAQAAVPHNLPAALTSFVGREADMVTLLRYLTDPVTRLVTLTGTGGVGKTRLALQTAHALLDEFPDGVFWVDLAALTDPALVASAVAQTLEVREMGEGSLVAAIQRHLRQRRALLVLDNFEHVLDAATLIVDVLIAAPLVKALVTSRATLRLSGEVLYPVPPLPCPANPRQARPAVESYLTLAHYPAVELFVQRARQVRPDLQLTPDNVLAAAEICQRLDGLPLAIELAAARSRILSPAALLPRIREGLKALSVGGRNRPARQHTMRHAIDWSYHLLDEDEQRLFQRLAVFVGGFTLDAAQAVAADTDAGCGAALEAVESLVDKSLLHLLPTPPSSAGDPGERLGMLETLREYALDRLAESGEEASVRQRHLGYFLTLARDAQPHLLGSSWSPWIERLERERENVRAALQWAIAGGGDADASLELTANLGYFWYALYVRDGAREGREWLERALSGAGAGNNALLAKAHSVLGMLAYHDHDFATAAAAHEQARHLYRAAGDVAGEALSLMNLGYPAYSTGEYARAEGFFDQALTLFRAVGDERGRGECLLCLGEVARAQARYDSAESLYTEALGRAHRTGDHTTEAMAWHNLGYVSLWRRNLAAAGRAFAEALRLAAEQRHRLIVGLSLAALACCLVAADGAPDRAATLFGAAAAALAELSGLEGLDSLDRDEIEHHRGALGTRLAPDELAAATSLGGAMPLDDAVDYALSLDLSRVARDLDPTRGAPSAAR